MPPVDMKTNYVKRCVGIAGDKLEIKKGELYINDKLADKPQNLQHKYKVKTKNGINEKILQDLEIYEGQAETDKDFIVICSQEKANKIKNLGDFIISVEKVLKDKEEPYSKLEESSKTYLVYPNHPDFKWNEDNFGPLVIPKKGMKITLNKENAILYHKVIQKYEWNKNVKIQGYKISIDGKEINEYTFKQDYFFMMGDNRHNSLDSRFWGFVPEDHVLGEASFTWLSLNANKGWFGGKIRWGRMFTWIK
jgi:signal peptidase I